MKKLFAYVMTCVLVFSFVGCSKTGTSSTDNSKSESSDTVNSGTDSDSSQSEAPKESASSSTESSDTTNNDTDSASSESEAEAPKESDSSSADTADTSNSSTDSASSQSEAPKESASSSAESSDTANSGTNSASGQSEAPTAKDSKTLVVYFSMPETADPSNMTSAEDDSTVVIDGKVLGNTQYMAYVIQENTGADIFRIEPETPYPTDHTTLVDLAAEEQDKNARPVIKSHVDNLEQYDTIFLGYPNWWGDMPMIVYSFLDEYDFPGKTIIPFNSHGGSGFSNTISTIRTLEPNATVNENGYTVSRNKVEEDAPNIISWINNLGYAK